MSSKPLVTICIPSYNAESFIGQTVETVLNQSFTDFELVVLDDRSTDQTVSVVKSFSDPRIRLIENRCTLGLSRNWNRVLSLEMGKYVKLLCDDDLLHPSCLEHQTAILDDASNSAAVLTLCRRNVINDRGELLLQPKRFFRSGLVSGPELIRKSIRRGSNLLGEPVVGLFRREALKDKEICDPGNPYLSDLNLWKELLRQGDAFLDPHCLASFRVSKNAATARLGLRQAMYFQAFARALRTDPFYRVGSWDLLWAHIFSLHWCVLRNLFINFHSNPTFRKFASCRSASAKRNQDVPDLARVNCN